MSDETVKCHRCGGTEWMVIDSRRSFINTETGISSDIPRVVDDVWFACAGNCDGVIRTLGLMKQFHPEIHARHAQLCEHYQIGLSSKLAPFYKEDELPSDIRCNYLFASGNQCVHQTGHNGVHAQPEFPWSIK